MSLHHNIGLHLRITDTLEAMARSALDLKINTFQFFLVNQAHNRYITLTPQEKYFFAINRTRFNHVFIHSSYWINLAAAQPAVFIHSKKLLKREIATAKALGIRYLVTHPGSAKGHQITTHDPDGKTSGIQTIARMLNTILKSENDVQILLENTAHGKQTIGNNLEDFIRIKNELAYPEKVGFCLDTAHAFSYGYELQSTDEFIKIVNATMGLDHIKLIHFNDTYDTLGSMQDRHAIPGNGKIGKNPLLQILKHPAFKKTPFVIEAPEDNTTIQAQLLSEIKTW